MRTTVGPSPNETCPTLTGTGFTVLSLAAIAYVGGVAYDVIDTPKAIASRQAINQHNRTHVMLMPTATDRSAGLARRSCLDGVYDMTARGAGGIWRHDQRGDGGRVGM